MIAEREFRDIVALLWWSEGAHHCRCSFWLVTSRAVSLTHCRCIHLNSTTSFATFITTTPLSPFWLIINMESFPSHTNCLLFKISWPMQNWQLPSPCHIRQYHASIRHLQYSLGCPPKSKFQSSKCIRLLRHNNQNILPSDMSLTPRKTSKYRFPWHCRWSSGGRVQSVQALPPGTER